MGFHNYIQERTGDGSELTDFVLSVFRGENGASTKERMDAATWLADRGFGKPTVNAVSQAPGFGDFAGDLRYLDIESGEYIEGRCECPCHVEKREWYLSDFGPPPHRTLWINEK